MKVSNGIKEYVICNLCEGRDTDTVLKYEISAEQFEFVRCKRCGLIYANPRPKECDIKRFVSEEYYDGKGIDTWDKNRERGFKNRLKLLNKYSRNKKGRLLDIGCGGGGFLKTAQNDGWNVEGIEPARSACKYAKETYGFDITNGELKDGKFQSNSFNVVTLCDVIYLMQDPMAELSETNRILKAGGMIALRIISYNPTFLPLWKMMIGMFRVNEDWLYVFSSNTVRQYLEKTGFKDIEVFNAIPTERPEGSLYANLLRKTIYIVAQAVYFLSMGKLVLGSCIEVFARKREN